MGLRVRFAIFLRIVVWILVHLVFSILFGFWLGGWFGASLGVGVAVFLLLAESLTAFDRLIRLLRAQKNAIAQAVEVDLNYALEEIRMGDIPELYVYDGARPEAIVIRPMLGKSGSEGAILLSRGLLLSVDKSELRSELRNAYLRGLSPGLRWRTVWCVAHYTVLNFLPKDWTLFFEGHTESHEPVSRLGPVRLLVFLAFYPVSIFFRWLLSSRAVPEISEKRALNHWAVKRASSGEFQSLKLEMIEKNLG